MSKVDLAKYDNSWYSPGRSSWVQILWFICNVLFLINPINPFSGLKVWILRSFGAKIGKEVIIKPGVNVKYPWRLTVGDYTWIGERAWIDNLADVHIGAHACISQGAYLLTGNHNFKLTGFDLITEEIKLEDGVWIGAMSIVAPGVTCYSHSVLAAGSLATTDMEAYTIYQGNPAQAKKKRVISS